MNYLYQPIRALLGVVTIAAVFTCSCRKEVTKRNETTSNLAFLTEERIKINQAVVIYDSTEITDSIEFVNPPTGKYYEWIVTPNNSCDSIVGSPHTGKIQFIFHCSGTYLITAKIYDSQNHNLIGNSDTIEVTVTNEILTPFQLVYPDDELNIRASLIRAWDDRQDTFPPDDIFIQLILETSKQYDYYSPIAHLDYSSDNSTNQYSYIFSNKVILDGYPFSIGYGIKENITGTIDLRGLTIGVPATLNITWLGTTYSGTVTLTSENSYSIDWRYSSGVLINSQ